MSQPAPIAGVPATENPQLPVHQPNPPSMLDDVFDVKGAKARLATLKTFFQDVMVYTTDGKGDYGILPGTTSVALYKPGAEKLAEFYRLIQRPTVTHRREEWDSGFFHYEVHMDLLSRDTGQVMGTGLGSCNTMEARYRWRFARLRCPECDAEAIIKGKAEYGGGFVCFEKKGGCKAKFKDDDPRITEQKLGQVENDDTYTLVNTVLKMAKKRALVDAVVGITRSAGLLVEEGDDDDDQPRGRGRRREGGGRREDSPRAEASVDTITDEQHQEFFTTFRANGHKWADVIAWVKREHGADLSKAKMPKGLFDAVMTRVRDKAPLEGAK